MKNFVKLSLAALGCVAGLGVAQAQTQGDWVLARYKGGQYWYPGIVHSTGSGRVTVRYDDGDRETLEVSQVKPYNWVIGASVECDFKGAGSWYAGKIASLSGESIGINYDDGDKERTKTGRCRSQ
jgi:DNA repair protein Crb2 Tudor domain